MSRTVKRDEDYREAEKKIKIGSIFITRFERARIIGARALQLRFQASPFVDVPSYLSDPLKIAAYELDMKALPITIRRHLPSGEFQDVPVSWLINDKY
jgi:DNA-directed RNA polymerases I, II, and III subunit RPABC2